MAFALRDEVTRAMHLRAHVPGTHYSRLLRLLYRGDLSRADLARRVGLTKATISTLVSDLIDLGLLVESRQQPIEGRGRPGRNLSLARTSWSVVTIDLSDDLEFRGAIMDLSGRQLRSLSVSRAGDTGQAAVTKAVELVDALVEGAPEPILGIGICVPGIVDENGVVIASNYLEWSQLRLGESIEERTGLPVAVANDADAAALAECDAHHLNDLLLVKIGTGVGAAITADGRPIHGPRLTAGEIGHIAIETGDDVVCICGRIGCLESVVSIPRLEARLDAAADVIAKEDVLRAAGHRLGVALAPLIGALGMDHVVISGPPHILEGTFLAAAREALRPRLMPELLEALNMRLSDLGASIMLRGGVIIVLRSVLGLS